MKFCDIRHRRVCTYLNSFEGCSQSAFKSDNLKRHEENVIATKVISTNDSKNRGRQ